MCLHLLPVGRESSKLPLQCQLFCTISALQKPLPFPSDCVISFLAFTENLLEFTVLLYRLLQDIHFSGNGLGLRLVLELLSEPRLEIFGGLMELLRASKSRVELLDPFSYNREMWQLVNKMQQKTLFKKQNQNSAKNMATEYFYSTFLIKLAGHVI